MKYLNIKLRRDIAKNWRQFFSVFLMALLSVLMFMGMQGAYTGLSTSVDQFINRSALPDSWVYSMTGFSKAQLTSIQKIKGVKSTATRTELNVSVPASSSHQSETYLTLDTQDQNNISKLYLDSGQVFNVNNTGGIWLNKEYVSTNHLKIGETIHVTLNNHLVSLKLLGVIQSADRIYYLGTTDFMAPNYAHYGYGLISDQTLAQAFAYSYPPNVLEIKNDPNLDSSKILDILGNSYAGYYTRTTLDSISIATSRGAQIRNLSLLFSFIFILLAVLAMYTTIRRLIENQSRDLATLKALGFSNRRISFHYASFGLVVGGAGAMAGALLSPLVSLFVLQSQKGQFSLPNWHIAYSPSSFAMIILVVAICLFSALWASRKANQGLPAVFLRGDTVKNAKKSFLERVPQFWSKISYAYRWALRDASAHKSRIIMGIIGVAGGLMLMIAGIGMPNSLYHLIDKTYNVDYTYTKKINTDAYPLLKAENLAQWLQINEGLYSKNGGYSWLFTVLGSGNEVHLKTETDQAIENGGIYISHGFAQYAAIKVGDKLSVRTTGSDKTYSFVVKGILISGTNLGGYVTQATFEQAGGTFMPQSLLVSKSPNIPNSAITSTMNKQDQKNNANIFVNSFMSTFFLIIALAVLLVVIVLYNLGSLSFVERTRDYATLRVLGFREKELRRITMVENITITFIGCLAGIPLGLWFLSVYVETMANTSLAYTPYISFENLFLASSVVWISSLSTSFFIGRRIRKLDMIEALKGVD